MTSVAVLGCGPAGLVAAHGALLAGADEVYILSKKRKSELFGAQYLHAPIPGATGKEPQHITYELRGDLDGYRRKVYGLKDDVEVSPQTLEAEHWAWDLRDTYDWLWDTYSDSIRDIEINDGVGFDVRSWGYDLVLSTIPANVLCHGEHTFGYEEIWAAGDAPERGIQVPYSSPNWTVVCNGEESPSWYRLSNLFGHQTVEWPGSMERPPVETVARVRKPLHNNCDCHSEIVRLGRYGAWTKGILVHEVFVQAGKAVIERG